MSRMSTSCVCFGKTVSVIVFLAPLLLTKCVSGDELTTGAEFVSGVEEEEASVGIETTTPETTILITSTNNSIRTPLGFSNSTDFPSVTLARNPLANISSSHSPAGNVTYPPAVSNTTHPASVNNVTNPIISTKIPPQSFTDTTRHPISITENPSPDNFNVTELHLSGGIKRTDSPVDTGATYPSRNASTTSSAEITSKPVKNETNVKLISSTTDITNTSGNVSITTTTTPIKSSSATNAPDAEVYRKNAEENVNITSSKNDGTTTSPVNSTGDYVENKLGSEENATISTNSTINFIQLQSKPCKNDADCNAISHAKCNVTSGQCGCMEAYSPMGSTICGKKLDDPCDDRCDAQNSQCNLDKSKPVCTCEDGLTASRDKTFCYGTPLLYGDVCDHNDNCTILGENMECNRHYCKCKDKYIRWDGSCKEKIDRLDAECNAETQVCYVASQSEDDGEVKRDCLGGFCRCRRKYSPHEGTCKEKIGLLGAPCNTSRHVCYVEEDGVNQKLNCRNGICQCQDTFWLVDGKCKKKIDILSGKCSPDKETCHLDVDGYQQKRHCANGTCQCKKDFLEDNGICKQKISLLGAPCNATSDVCYLQEDGELQTTHCKDKVCQCKAEFALKDRKCRKEKSTTGRAQNIGPSAWVALIVGTVDFLRRSTLQ